MMDWKNISDFYFAWPWALLLLLLIPVGWWLYLKRLRTRLRALALHFSHTAVLEQINAQPAAWKRLLAPISATLLAICLIVGLARPTVTARIPVSSLDMMLVLDISLSMMAEDIRPDRLTAAKEAAAEFVKSLPKDVHIGLEVFAGSNYLLSPPTDKHQEIIAYLRSLRREDLKPRTEIGSALHAATRILENKDESLIEEPTIAPKAPNSKQETATPSKPVKQPDRVVVLLSDGDSHEGYPWDEAAREAKKANIIVHTIGVGSPQGSYITYQGMELPVNFDEQTLRNIAELGGGSYFRVFKESDFRRVYEQIRERSVHYEQQEIDLAFALAGAGLMVLLCGLLLVMLAL